MKTLDEVIKSFERCGKIGGCKGCKYARTQYECSAMHNIGQDALHYLKTYRENQQTYLENSRKAEEARERYLEAVRNCELAENKYRKLSQNLGEDRNDPLTWEQLKGMEGKPVWVEFYGANRWIIPEEFRFDIAGREYLLAQDGGLIFRFQQHEVWEAYRKERS